MPITQIPFQDPVAPPEKPQPEQLGLYDAQEWETAYRDLDDDARVPHLLIQLQDDLARSRRREAAWISIIVHMILIFCMFKIEWLEKYLPWHSVVVKNSTNVKDLTFLELPPDLQKVPHKPNTNIISDKNRTAMTRHPNLDVKELRKSLASPPPGASGLSGPQMAQQAPAQPSAGLTRNPPASEPQQPPNPQIAQLQSQPKPDIKSEFSKYGGSMSAGEQIQEAARAARRGGGQQGDGGDLGLGNAAHGRQVGNLEILSDTMGVDFGPYLQRVLHDVKQNWYDAIPESAAMKHGNLIIEFAITKDGKVAGMKLVASSGDVPLDRAAWAGITGSNPFPALPSEFGGQYLALRFRFYYNPTKEEREGLE
jgi:TonB family protein